MESISNTLTIAKEYWCYSQIRNNDGYLPLDQIALRNYSLDLSQCEKNLCWPKFEQVSMQRSQEFIYRVENDFQHDLKLAIQNDP